MEEQWKQINLLFVIEYWRLTHGKRNYSNVNATGSGMKWLAEALLVIENSEDQPSCFAIQQYCNFCYTVVFSEY